MGAGPPSVFSAFLGDLTGLILVVAGVAKLLHLDRFRAAVRSYDLLPDLAVRAVAIGLPPAETIVGLMLLSGFLFPWSGFIAASLFGLFVGAVTVNLLRGKRDVACGCFGPEDEELLSWSIVVRNSLLAGMAVAGSLDRTGIGQFSTQEKLATLGVALGLLGLAAIYRSLKAASRLEEALDLPDTE